MNWLSKIAQFNIENPNPHTSQGPAELVFTNEGAQHRVRFAIQHDDGYSDYLVTALSLHMPQMYPPVGRPSYVLIQKSQTGASGPIDDQFIQTLTASIGMTPIEWSAGSNPMIDMLNDATGKRYTDNPDEVDMTEFEETEVLPLPSGISVSKVEGAWSSIYKADPSSIDYFIKSIVDKMKAAVQLMMEANLLHFYEISDTTVVPKEFVRSQRGQEMWDQGQNDDELHIGYYKHVLQQVLQPYPTLLKWMLEYVIPRSWSSYADIPPSPQKVDLQNSNIIDRIVDESSMHITKFIHDSVLSFDDNKLKSLEFMMQKAEQSNISSDIIGSMLYWFTADEFEEIIENIKNGNLMYWYPSYFSPAIRQLFNEAGYGRQIESVYAAASEGAMQALRSQDPYSVKQFYAFYKELDLPPEAIQAYEQFGQQLNEEKVRQYEEREKATRTAKMMVRWNTAIYDLPAGEGFTDTKDNSFGQYISDNYRDYEFGDHLFESANERAQEEAYANIEERQSEVYPVDLQGEFDEKELIEDIGYEWDEFFDETNYFETPEGQAFWSQAERLPEEQKAAFIIKMISEKLRDEFIAWKREGFAEEEEGELWKYEPEPDEQDIWKAMSDIADDIAYEYGILHAEMNWERNVLDLYVHSKYRDQAIALAKEIARINKQDDDAGFNDFGFDRSTIIEIEYVDTESADRFTVQELLSKFSSRNWLERLY